MSKLIDELQQEHLHLAKVLVEIKEKGLSSEGQKLLNLSKAALLAHLKKEDTFLYPDLNQAAKSDSQLQVLLSNFASDMEYISKAAFEFFARWEQGGDPDEFTIQLEFLVSVLQSRIRREETLLYPEFEKLDSKKLNKERNSPS